MHPLHADWVARQQSADVAHEALKKTDLYKVWRVLQDAADKAREEYRVVFNEEKDDMSEANHD